MAFTADEELEMALRWFRGDEHAVRLFADVARASQIADDICDEPWTTEQRASAMAKLWATLLALPANPVYASHYNRIHPLILMAVLDWEASNAWQKSTSPEARVHGYVRREALEQVVHFLAYLAGGTDWAMQVVREVHEFYHVMHADGETLETWAGELDGIETGYGGTA